MAFVKFKPIVSSFIFHSRISVDEIKEEINYYICNNEEVLEVYKSKRDILLLTDKRLVLIDKKGLRGFRRSIYGINYDSISSCELTIREFDSKLSIFMDSGHLVMMKFSKGIKLDEVYHIYKYINQNTAVK